MECDTPTHRWSCMMWTTKFPRLYNDMNKQILALIIDTEVQNNQLQLPNPIACL